MKPHATAARCINGIVFETTRLVKEFLHIDSDTAAQIVGLICGDTNPKEVPDALHDEQVLLAVNELLEGNGVGELEQEGEVVAKFVRRPSVEYRIRHKGESGGTWSTQPEETRPTLLRDLQRNEWIVTRASHFRKHGGFEAVLEMRLPPDAIIRLTTKEDADG